MSREVPRVPLSEITAEEFRERYMVPNEPVLLTGAAQGWRATAEWIDHAGQPAVGELATLFPRSQVTVVDGAGRRQEMSLSEYSAWWAGRDGAAPLYLKDWHLPCHHPEYGAYDLPEHVADDWQGWSEDATWEALYFGVGPLLASWAARTLTHPARTALAARSPRESRPPRSA